MKRHWGEWAQVAGAIGGFALLLSLLTNFPVGISLTVFLLVVICLPIYFETPHQIPSLARALPRWSPIQPRSTRHTRRMMKRAKNATDEMDRIWLTAQHATARELESILTITATQIKALESIHHQMERSGLSPYERRQLSWQVEEALYKQEMLIRKAQEATTSRVSRTG